MWHRGQTLFMPVSLCLSLTGRDPLTYSQRKIDIAAVASVLKAYFRELSVPLFPTTKYQAFIDCTRKWGIPSGKGGVVCALPCLPVFEIYLP